MIYVIITVGVYGLGHSVSEQVTLDVPPEAFTTRNNMLFQSAAGDLMEIAYDKFAARLKAKEKINVSPDA